MTAKRHAAAPTGRNKLAQGKERSAAALGHAPQNTLSPEGATHVGELHGSWQRVKLGHVAEVIMGQAPRGDETNFEQRGTVFVKAGEFGPVRPVVREWTTRPLKFAKAGDVLICVVGATCGKLNLSIDCAIGRSVAALRPGERTFDSFLHFQLMPKVLTLRAGSTGSAQGVLSRDVLAGIDLVLPPLPEQRRIVAEIEKQFTRLEAGVAALRRVQANLKRYRAAVLKAACEGRLVPTEAELRRTADFADGADKKLRKSASSAKSAVNSSGYETGSELLARILTERRQIHERAQAEATRKKKYKEPMQPSVPADQKLPEGWTWAAWDQIGLSQNGRPFPSAEYNEIGFKLLRPGNLHVSGKVVWSESNTRCMPQKFADENPDLIVRGGELVMNLTAQSLKDEFLGRVCITGEDEGCLLNQRLARLTPIIVLPKFVLCLLKAWRFRRYVDGLNSGSLIQHMFTSQLAEFTFPLPPLAEQTRIVAEVERRLSVVEELESVVSANLQRASSLRQSILKKAFSGELA